jgi:hypothetical protein
MSQSEVITTLEQATPECLTAALRRAGALTAGAVAAVEAGEGQGNWSSNARLRLAYTAGATGDCPERLFLKMVNTDLGDGEWFGPSEVDYYTRDYLDVPDAPLVRCYDAAYSEAQHRYHLLLDDLSESHISAADQAPTLAFGQALAEGLAALHARWWGAARLAEAGAPVPGPDAIRRFISFAEPGARAILDGLTEALQPGGADLIRDLFARHPAALVERARDPDGFTLVHGDAGEYNILVPRQDDRPVYLIDRQPFDWSLTTWLGPYDLAYALVLDWDVNARRQWERPVLERYHQSLRARGVGTSWDRVWDDYRLCAAMGVYIATEYARGGIGGRWQSHYMGMLDRSLTACRDLDAAALW